MQRYQLKWNLTFLAQNRTLQEMKASSIVHARLDQLLAEITEFYQEKQANEPLLSALTQVFQVGCHG